MRLGFLKFPFGLTFNEIALVIQKQPCIKWKMKKKMRLSIAKFLGFEVNSHTNSLKFTKEP
jgi:hypothetical protein